MTEEFEVDDDLHPIDPGRILCAHAEQGGDGAHWLAPGEKCGWTPPASLGATWNGRDGEKCPEPNCDGVKDHGGKHFAWMAD